MTLPELRIQYVSVFPSVSVVDHENVRADHVPEFVLDTAPVNVRPSGRLSTIYVPDQLVSKAILFAAV